MNYFEWFGIEKTYFIDQAELRKAFLLKSREVHPDKDASQGIDIAAMNNKAYTTLKDDAQRLTYILTIEDILIDGEKFELPSSFLMEMLEINMAIEEAIDTSDQNAIESLKSSVDQLKMEEFSKINDLLKDYKSTVWTEEQRQQLKLFYYIRKYLLRIEENISNFASR